MKILEGDKKRWRKKGGEETILRGNFPASPNAIKRE